MAKLILSLDGSVIREVPLDKERVTIGRKPQNDIQIENLAVSSEHACIVTILNDSFLEDLGSTNGTLVNGNPIKKHILQNNDVVEVGNRAPTLELRTRARRINRQCGKLGLVMVDYLQLMSAPNQGYQNENRATEISEISRSLKALAKELSAPVVALSQLNRALETRNDKRPMMSDLRESGAIEQDADLILFIYRDEVYYPEKPESKGTAEVIIGKQRNGPIGRIDLTFLAEHTRFEDRARDAYR